MTTLVGSEKQINAAEKLRTNFFKELEEMKEEVLEDDGNMEAWKELYNTISELSTFPGLLKMKFSFSSYCFDEDFYNDYGKKFVGYAKREEKYQLIK